MPLKLHALGYIHIAESLGKNLYLQLLPVRLTLSLESTSYSSFCQPRFSLSVCILSVHAPTTSSRSVKLLTHALSPSITPSLFHSRLTTYTSFTNLSTIDSLPASELTPRTSWPDRFFWVLSISFFMVALWIGQTIIFSSCGFFLSYFFSSP